LALEPLDVLGLLQVWGQSQHPAGIW
jgi:hypothetical protein